VHARFLTLPFTVAAIALSFGTARAITVQICDGTSGTNCSPSLAPLGTVVTNADGSKTWTLTNPFNGSGYTVNNWVSTTATDPFVTNNVGITNNQGTPQTFIATVTLPIPAFSFSQIVASSVGVTATDSDGSGSVTVQSVTPNGIYTGTINGVGALTLLPDVTTVSCSTAGCSTTTSANFPSGPAGPGVATTIGITLEFTLSPFDSAGLTSRFEIEPEPTTGLLLASGFVGLAVIGRKRRA